MHVVRKDRELVYPGKVLDFYKDTVILPDGKEEKWDFLSHKKGGGACVVPVLPDGRIVLIRQFRPAVGRWCCELPAGARDADDPDSAVTAMRELREETGIESSRVHFLARIDTAIAYCDEVTDIYLAEDCKVTGEQEPDEAEEIDCRIFTMEELLEMIFTADIRDAKTVCGVLAAKAWLEQNGSVHDEGSV